MGAAAALVAFGCDASGGAERSRSAGASEEVTSAGGAPSELGPERARAVSAPANAAPTTAIRAAAGCRVISLRGAGRTSAGQRLAAPQLLGAGWIELEPGALAHLKHTETSREWTLEGPARAWVCPQGREEIILGTGVLQTELGPGARPGAEVTIGTAFGSVQYGDARARLSVSDRELRLQTSSGDAWLTPFSAAPSSVLRGADVRRGPSQRVEFQAAMRWCAAAAARAAELAAGLLAGGAAGLGQRAAEHVRARHWARASCANAGAAVLQQARGAELEPRLREVSELEETWQRVVAGPG